MQAGRRWLQKLALLSLSILFALALTEIVLRVIGYSNPYVYTYDEELGWALRPNTSGWVRKEGEAYVRINSVGFRDDSEPTNQPAPNTYRIAVLGDSFVEALQVPSQQTFLHQLRLDLASCPNASGKSIEVLNFGVSGYGTAQELLMLRERVSNYNPNLVVLVFTPGNDLSDNSREISNESLRPYFLLREGQLVPDRAFRDAPAYKQKKAALSRFLYSAITIHACFNS